MASAEDLRALVEAALEDDSEYWEVVRAVRGECGHDLRHAANVVDANLAQLAASGHPQASAMHAQRTLKVAQLGADAARFHGQMMRVSR